MIQERLAAARGVLFDKDGTLFPFERAGGEIGERLIQELAQGDRALSRTLARLGGFDPAQGRYAANSPIAARAWSDLAEVWAAELSLWRADELEEWLQLEAASFSKLNRAPAAADLAALLDRFVTAGLALGVATHDAEASARRQLRRVGALDRFDFIAGFDSGYAPKPDRAMFDGFCAAAGLEPGAVVVVGDGPQDLGMGLAGGALAVIGVLSGPAEAADLEEHADLLLPSICDLPDAMCV